jgi:hypothetical protein
MKVSVCPSAYDKTPTTKTLEECLDIVRSGGLKARVQHIRECVANRDDDNASAAKRMLPAMMPSGIFSRADGEHLIEYSGLLCADIDDCDEHMDETLEVLRGDPYCLGWFRSPSGTGIKAFYRHEDGADAHWPAWWSMAQHLKAQGVILDETTADVPRLCFLSWDTEAVLRDGHVLPVRADAPAREHKRPRNQGGMELEPIASNRNNALTSLGGALRSSGLDHAGIEAALLATNRSRCVPPLMDAEVRGIAQSVMRYRPNVDVAHGAMVSADLIKNADNDDDEEETVPPIEEDLPADLLTGWPGWIGLAVEDMRRTCPVYQPALALATSLAAWGVVVGRQVSSPSDLRTNLYTVGLCPTGGGKEGPRHYWKNVFSLGKHSSIFQHPELIASESAVYSSVRCKPSALFMIDEIGRIMANINGAKAAAHERGIMTALLTLYSQANSVFAGKAFADQKSRPVDPIVQPCVGIAATGNPDDFWNSFTAADATSGFLPRLLIFQVPRSIPEPQDTVSRDPDPRLIEVVDRWAANRSGLSDARGPQPHQVPYRGGAAAIWRDYRRDLHRRRNEATGRLQIELMTRLWENAQRVALCCAAARCSGPDDLGGAGIGEEDSERAIRLVESLYARTLHHAGLNIAESEHHRTQQRLRRAIEEAGEQGLSQRDIARRFSHVPAKSRDEMLTALAEAGWIALELRQGARGRPRNACVSTRFARRSQGGICAE